MNIREISPVKLGRPVIYKTPEEKREHKRAYNAVRKDKIKEYNRRAYLKHYVKTNNKPIEIKIKIDNPEVKESFLEVLNECDYKCQNDKLQCIVCKEVAKFMYCKTISEIETWLYSLCSDCYNDDVKKIKAEAFMEIYIKEKKITKCPSIDEFKVIINNDN